VNNASFHGASVSVERNEPNAERVNVRGNTFNGGEVTVMSTHALVESNTGTFDVELGGDMQKTLQNNVFSGTVEAHSGGEMLLRNNTIAGGFDVSGDATLILTRNRIRRVDPSRHGIYVHSLSRAKLLAYGFNQFTDDTLGQSNQYDLLRIYLGGEVSIWNSSITGDLSTSGGGSLNLYGNKEVKGKISVSSDSSSEIVANRLVLSGTLDNSGHLKLTDNVISGYGVSPTGYGADTAADAQGNTFRALDAGTEPYELDWAFDVKGVDSAVKIEGNCIESELGVIVRGPSDVTGTLNAENNWWGHASGPRHHELNPEGRGALISGPVDFDPPLPSPSPCRETPPQLPVSVSTVIDSGGGSLLTPDGEVSLDFPPGAVAGDTTVTYDSDGSTLRTGAAAASAPADDQVAIRTFDLSAVISGTTAPVTSFSKPYTLTLYYADEDCGPALEHTLGLYWWDGSTWLPEPSCQLYPDEDRLAASLDHMTLFAVMGQTRRCYLPLVLRGS
jgi:hypothetical protein